ncbi:UPF0545 protein C22orf39 homolog isoform X1 [Nycticebus coucang]|uniref:UPF0545 protein C22orf39 homolog isoform X1 n=1 Tax=Nycticebus coucang TaxID=9470 RepID=UPI00234E2EE4|nr:UPF0545 protein C22orf39 homolog isoform X1 [Nycticebus coucang]
MADGRSWQPPRPCEAYHAEWKLCRSARHFLHHYYVHGERPRCEQWRRDLASCRDWEERRSAEAQLPRCGAHTLLRPSHPSHCGCRQAAMQAARAPALMLFTCKAPTWETHSHAQREKEKTCRTSQNKDLWNLKTSKPRHVEFRTLPSEFALIVSMSKPFHTFDSK